MSRVQIPISSVRSTCPANPRFTEKLRTARISAKKARLLPPHLGVHWGSSCLTTFHLIIESIQGAS